MVERSQVFNLQAAEKDRSPLAFVAGLTSIRWVIVMTCDLSCSCSGSGNSLILTKMSKNHTQLVSFKNNLTMQRRIWKHLR